VVDEWGAWLAPMPGSNRGFLVQQNSLRDAVLAALNLNIFARHADRVRMANIAQMINVLQAMILTSKEKMILAPTYHVFRMYVPFQNATLNEVERVKAGRSQTTQACSRSTPQGWNRIQSAWSCRESDSTSPAAPKTVPK
jgi:alpha-L-arabinofuranosidase